MKLVTAKISKLLKKYNYLSQDGKGENAIVIARFFGGSSCTWYILEGTEDEDIVFGLANLGYGFEYGTMSLSELQSIRFPLGLGVERDKCIEPGTMTLSECMKIYGEHL